MQTFQVGTLFDHYCARHHVGFGLDHTRAVELRTAMDRAVQDTHGDALRNAFASVLRAPGNAALALPRAAYRFWYRRFRARGGAPVEAEQLDEKLRRAESAGWLTRAIAAVGGVGQGYAHGLAASFDETWAT
jgi:hypothetical protein